MKKIKMSGLGAVVFIGFFLWAGYVTPNEIDVPPTMKYIDNGQVPVPPEAISPFEPKEVTYVNEPSIELDSDWNLGIKLYSKFRYTHKFAKRWRAKYGYTPTRPMMSNKDFFDKVDLSHPDLKKVKAAVATGDFTRARDEYLSYQASRKRVFHFKKPEISDQAGKSAMKNSDKTMNDPKFPGLFIEERYSLFSAMRDFKTAYLYSNDIKYTKAWLDLIAAWSENHRPPAQRLKAYIGFIYSPYWVTLSAGGTSMYLSRNEQWFIGALKQGLDKDKLLALYKSILEHAEFIYMNNDVFMPANWQTCQCEALVKFGAYFPSFKKSGFYIKHAWKLMQEHMATETFDDGSYSENSVNYSNAVALQHFRVVQIIRKLGFKVPENFLEKWKSMFLCGTKFITPLRTSIPVGDGGTGADGYLIKRLLAYGALEFPDPTLKYFTEKYPAEVKKIAYQYFDNPEEVLAAYDKIKPKKPSFTSKLIPDSGWAVMRHSWDKESPYLFFDGGWDEAWHSHPDFGSFNIWAYGEPLILNSGKSGPYEADISKRWYKQTIAHNTVLVDSRSMRKSVNNRITQWWTGPQYDFVDAMSDGYRWIGVLHNRRVLFVKPNYWIITDFLPGPGYYNASFQTSGYHKFDWLAHFQDTKLRIDERTKRIDTLNDEVNIALVPLNADQVRIRESKGPTVTKKGVLEAPYISLEQERMPFVQYQVLLLPYQGKEAPEINIKRLVADKTDRVHRQNIGYEIAVLERKDVFLESGNSKEKASFGKYEFRGAVAHIRNAEKAKPDYLLVDADYLAHNGKLLFSAPIPIKALEFVISEQNGSRLEIKSESKVSGVKIYAPAVEKVKLNNKSHEFTRAGDYIIL
ncbi:MAG: alginate lyase family protein [Planctomycetes bacterium]|nr:alginate lyase family protein [Planctomycetota bacterium]